MCVEGAVRIGDIRRSQRSGRLILPPLTYWSGQRLMVSMKIGASPQLVQGADNLVDAGNGTRLVFTDETQVDHVLQ